MGATRIENLETGVDETNYPGDTVSSGGSVDQFGSWVEIAADVGNNIVSLVESLVYLTSIALTTFEMEIGVGAAASESAVTKVVGKIDIGALSLLKMPIINRLERKIPANSRVAVRIKDNVASSLNYTTMLRWKSAE